MEWISLCEFLCHQRWVFALFASSCLATVIYTCIYLFKLVASHQDCCQPKCELFNCTAPYAPSAAKKDIVRDPGKHTFLATTQRSQKCYAVASKSRSSSIVLICLDLDLSNLIKRAFFKIPEDQFSREGLKMTLDMHETL